MEELYIYIKTLGYDLRDIKTFEELRQIMSIDSLKSIAAAGGYEDGLARAIKERAAARAARTRVRVNNRKKRRANYNWGSRYKFEETDTGYVFGIDKTPGEE